jgi:hypothetical protein
MGVTYSRSSTGTGMPSKERFQTRPMGRAFKRCLLSRNFLFRGRQQPKLRRLFFRFGYIRFFGTLTIESNGVRQGKN